MESTPKKEGRMYFYPPNILEDTAFGGSRKVVIDFLSKEDINIGSLFYFLTFFFMTKEYTTTSSREDVRRGLRHRFHSQPIFGHSEFETKKIFDSLDPESTKKRPTSVWMNQWSKDQDGDKQMPGKQDEKEGTNPDRQD